MLIKEITPEDIPAWLSISHEADDIIARMVPDIAVYYLAFTEYISRKLASHEAFKAHDTISGKCMGVIAFTREKNMINFLGIPGGGNLQTIGSRLVEHAIKQMDGSKEVFACVPDSTAGVFRKERNFYKSLSFIETSDKIMENGIQAVLMKKAR